MDEVSEDKQSEVEPQEKAVRKRRRVYGVKVCQVCGDKALAHHFGALACDTCKAFFRRNALCKEEKQCLFKGACPIDVRTRRFCPACRLKKCFNVGMQPDLILDDQEKRQRIQKISDNKCKKELSKVSAEPGNQNITRHSPECSVSTTNHEALSSTDQTPINSDHISSLVEQAWQVASSQAAPDDPQAISNPGSFSEDGWGSQEKPGIRVGQNFCQSSSDGLGMDHKSHTTVICSRQSVMSPESSYSSIPFTSSPGIEGVSATGHSSTHVSSVVTPQPNPLMTTSRPLTPVAVQALFTAPFTHVSSTELPSDPFMYWRLSEDERTLLTQLSAAYQDTVLSVLQDCPPKQEINNRNVTHELCLGEFEYEATCAVSFAKRMEDFRQLRVDEQIALLKASTCQVLGIRSCALFIAEKNAWLTRKGYFTIAQCELLMPNHPHADAGLNFCKSIKSIVKNDFTLYALLHCIVLFDPSDERIIDRQLINSIRDKYIILLRHYLESLYSYAHSEKYMLALQENLIAYRSLCQEGKPLIKKYFPSIPNKLLLEVLDLD